tara:strand:- start:1212 stop:1604 length:393 start_codon:yes stop_codon:yes gene_type:complete
MNDENHFKPLKPKNLNQAIEEEEEEGAISVPLDELKVEDLSDEQMATLETVMDIPVTISMEVGHCEITIRNLLQLNQGSVVELERIAGEPLDVMVNGMLLAHGEVVVVNDKFGIRLTDVISLTDRIKKLK